MQLYIEPSSVTRHVHVILAAHRSFVKDIAVWQPWVLYPFSTRHVCSSVQWQRGGGLGETGTLYCYHTRVCCIAGYIRIHIKVKKERERQRPENKNILASQKCRLLCATRCPFSLSSFIFFVQRDLINYTFISIISQANENEVKFQKIKDGLTFGEMFQ